MSNSTNPYEQDGQDLDMLTDDELIERGYEPRFAELSELSEITPEPEYKCCFCNRKMKAPVTRFEKFGVDFVPEGEKAHEGCARREFEKVAEVMKTVMGD